MRIKKTSQTTPVQAEVVNTYSDSENNAYSCDYMNELNTYKTTEQRIGTWIDGKPIYRKVLQYTYSTTGTHQESLSSLNIDTITSYNWNCLVNNTYIINAYDFQDNNAKCNLFFDKNKIYMVNGTTWTSAKFTLILEYTKTTV